MFNNDCALRISHISGDAEPVEQEGPIPCRGAARPLPDSDRRRLSDRDAERRILIETTGDAEAKPKRR